MANVSALFVKIFSLEYYQSTPIDQIDSNYSPISGQYVTKVPVIRAYGTTPEGLKVCANIHGAFPYFFVCLPYHLTCGDLDGYCRSLALSLEGSIKKTANVSSDYCVIFDASIVSGRSIYGFQKSEAFFVKLYVLDPSVIPKCAELLLSGSVMNREFQPCEVHIPYLLQFCVDYNLYGMNYLQVSRFKLRCSKGNTSPNFTDSYIKALVSESDFLSPKDAEKWSSVEFEIDIAAGDILNRLELSDTTIQNPGLEAMWSEEKHRRSNQSMIGTPPEVPTAESLLPSSRSSGGVRSKSEEMFLAQWKLLVESSLLPARDFDRSSPKDPNDRVAEWLNSSQSELDELVQLEPQLQLTNLPTSSLDLDSRSDHAPLESKTSSSQLTLSSAGLEELCLLASFAEELDAWVPSTNCLELSQANLVWLRNRATTTSQLNRLSLMGPQTHQLSNWSIKWASSPKESEAIKDDTLKSPSTQSQDLLDSQPSTSPKPRPSTSRPGDSKSIVTVNWDDALEDPDEDTLISNATQSALAYHLASNQSHVICDLDQSDDECYSQLLGPIESHTVGDQSDPGHGGKLEDRDPEDLWADESPLPQHFMDSLDLYDLSQADSDEAEGHPALTSSLNPITEEYSLELDDVLEESQPDLDISEDLLSSSPWLPPANSNVRQSTSGETNQVPEIEEFSDLFLDPWSSGDEEEKSIISNRHIPQLDGTSDHGADDFNDTDSQVPPKKPRIRRRLGLRLSAKPSTSVTASSSVPPTTSKPPQSSTSSVTVSCPSSLETPRNVQPVEVEDPKTAILRTSGKTELTSDSHGSPVVLLKRLEEQAHSSQLSSTTLGRLSPSEEFEDIPISSSYLDQIGKSTCTHDRPSFQDVSFSQTELMNLTSSSLDDFDNPGRLTLYSQTQLSLPSPSSPPQIAIHIDTGPPSPSFQLPFWRPSIRPPSLNDVRDWLFNRPPAASQGHLKTVDLDQPAEEKDSDRSMNASLMDNHVMSGSQGQRDERTFQATASKPFNDTSLNSTTVSDLPCSDRVSSIGSVSLLYQAASQRCYLPVQVDHTTTISLELHCQSRLTSAKLRKSTSSRTNPSSSDLSSRSQYGLVPDPNLDPIRFVCLSIRRPSLDSKSKDVSRNVFVLLNKAEFSGASDCQTVSQLPAKCRLGLSNYLNRAMSDKKKNKHRKKRALDVDPLFVWCADEWSLLSWVVYFAQSLDPEILVGYDVERHSWGYLVDRARQLGRLSLPRELSRLCPDIIDCPHCSQCINQCNSLLKSDPNTASTQSAFFDSFTFTRNLIGSSCQCPCNPIGRYNQTSRSDHRTTATTTFYRAWPSGPGAGRTGANFACPGRVIFCMWRTLMHEVSLFEYSVETCVKHLLKETMPRFTFGQLSQWFVEESGVNRWRTVDYWINRSMINLRLMDAIDLIGRTSEFARVFGIEFYHVMSRGSQYRVESLLCRMAKQLNFILPSPNVTQRARQRAPETIPLNLEPESVLFVDGPVAVLDFQSLYPSIMIAYNYCYSTLVGRLPLLEQVGEGNPYDLGCLTHLLPVGTIRTIGHDVTVSPNGVVFVNKSIREGILPRMLRQLLTTRLMVKDSMKLHKNDSSLTRLLDARQLGLKLMANVIFGYTAASFSGRMPCVDLGDSIVHKARETLEDSIQLIQSGHIQLPESCQGLAQPRVVYGDTDSVFIHLPGYGKQEAFDAAHAIAQTITNRNPAPILLKVEKIYYPCLLEAKKRYVGYAYESPTQLEPKFDAKGIETVRRDSSPFVGKFLELVIRLLFDQFKLPDQIRTSPSGYSEIQRLTKLAEYKVRNLVHQFSSQLIRGMVPFHDCLLARPFWGMTAYKPGAFAPALQVARRLLSMDPRNELLPGERVVYYIAPGRPNQTLISCVRSLNELQPFVSKDGHSRRAMAPRLNVAYYLDKQLIPPLERMAELMGWSVRHWLINLPRFGQSQAYWRLTHITANDSRRLSQSSLHPLDNLGSPSSSWTQSPEPGPSNRWPTTRRTKRFCRPSALMRAFVAQPPRVCPGCASIIPRIDQDRTDRYGHCPSCLESHSWLGPMAEMRFGFELNRVQTKLATLESLCSRCIGAQSSTCDPCWMCTQISCPVHSQRLIAVSNLASLVVKYRSRIENPPPEDPFAW